MIVVSLILNHLCNNLNTPTTTYKEIRILVAKRILQIKCLKTIYFCHNLNIKNSALNLH